MTGRTALAFLFLLAGCGGASLEQLKSAAAFSLQCHEARISFTPVGSQKQLAAGCGKEATFVEHCHGQFRDTACRWELESTVYPAGTRQKERDLAEERRHGTAPDPPPPPPP